MITFLDTDVCIAILRGKEPALEAKLKELSISEVEIPSVVAAELWVGVYKAEQPKRAEAKLSLFLRELKTTSFDEDAAIKYGEIRADLERRGISIGGNDLLIAAIALTRGGRLVTRNHREYSRVPGLPVDLW